MSLHSPHKADCCGAHIRCWHDCEGVSPTWCQECGEETCSGCASFFDAQDGYGEDGREVHTVARCKACPLVPELHPQSMEVA